MRKILCVMLAALLCLGMLACNGEPSTGNTSGNHGAEDYKPSDDLSENRSFFEWSDSDENAIIGYSESGAKQTELLIPAGCTKVTGLKKNDNVKYIEFAGADTQISAYAFSECSNLQTVKLPENLKVMERSIFSQCKSLKNITIPDSVTEIKSNVFWRCESLEVLELGANVEKLGAELFEDCKSLKEIKIPDAVTEIEMSTFKDCKALEKVTFGSGLKQIAKSAFQNCISLKTIALPEGVTTLGAYAFGYCDALESVYMPASVISAETSSLAQTHVFTLYVVEGSYMDSFASELMGQEFIEKKYQ